MTRVFNLTMTVPDPDAWYSETGDVEDESTTIARRLANVIGRIESGSTSGTVRDQNGNTVGHFAVEQIAD